ncbi:response regulator [Mucilaginibacter myungsuensis]|uniref:Response regulator n=1 Tax=Mucilaginibacter myungsuensis TaxID=649104 RepID=A0A929KUP6_9SPHI|nr:response regulator [Mucilaginibacter myungsuensis]MBE9661899.1 response regulator [Mucilaginibacter myungsuensis]MDN3599667.1 response regulator [Mucilaginibacter myungsuensis]
MQIISKQKKILVLDRNNRIRSVVDEMLIYEDWDVSLIYDPYSVHQKAQDKKPDVILLDYLLLDNDCVNICWDLREDPELQRVPIIVVTSYKSRRTNADVFKCDALFIKPLDMTVLASRMEYLMAS